MNATNSATVSEVVAAFLLSDEALPSHDSLWSDSEEELSLLDPGPMATPPPGYPFTTRPPPPPPPSPAPTEERLTKEEKLRRMERVARALCERAMLMTLQCRDP